MKPLPKGLLIPLGLTAAASATYDAIFLKKLWIRLDYTHNLKGINIWYHENN